MKRRKCEDFAAKLWQLEAAGCPTMSRALISLRIELTDEPVLHELDNGLAAYVVPVLLTNGPEELTITDVELDVPWEDAFLHLLDESIDGGYRFLRAQRQVYDREEVLNHFIFDNRVLEPGGRKSGLLLASGFPIPPAYQHNELINASLFIADQFGDFLRMPLKLRLDRRVGLDLKPAKVRVGKSAETPLAHSANSGSLGCTKDGQAAEHIAGE